MTLSRVSTQPLSLEPQVEVCAGCGRLSKALRMAGFQGKEFDAPWKALVSNKHCLSTGGDIQWKPQPLQDSGLCGSAGSCALSCGLLRSSSEVWNTRPGGILVFAPPCATWVFLSSSATGRSWSCPGGDTTSTVVKLANIFVRRMIYMLLGCMVCVHPLIC